MYWSNIGLREAKANLSRLVKEVQKGAEIILTDRGKPVAKLSPIVEGTLSFETRVAKLEDRGLLEPLGSKLIKLPPPQPQPGEKAQELLQEDRNQ